MTRPAFTGVVLTGGRSTRMGRDKLFVPVDGRPLVGHAIDALSQAGAAAVLGVGGREDLLAPLGVHVLADRYPGEGPLGAVVTALSSAGHDLVVVVSGDTTGVTASDVTALVDAAEVSSVDVVVADLDGTPQPLLACYRRRRVLPVWSELFDAGERSPMRALASVSHRLLAMEASRIIDLDCPDDVHRYAASRRRREASQRGRQE